MVLGREVAVSEISRVHCPPFDVFSDLHRKTSPYDDQFQPPFFFQPYSVRLSCTVPQDSRRLSVPVMASSSEMDVEKPPEVEAASSGPPNSPSTDGQSRSLSTLLALLPREIFFHILSYSISISGGLQISNNPKYASNLSLIGSLLKIDSAAKYEIRRLIFSQPLHIYITTGDVCNCEKVQKWIRRPFQKSEDVPPMTLLLRKMLQLPLDKWQSIVIHFQPELKEEGCFPRQIGNGWSNLCSFDHGFVEEKSRKVEKTDRCNETAWSFIHGVERVRRQSKILGQTLRRLSQTERRLWNSVLNHEFNDDQYYTSSTSKLLGFSFYNPKPGTRFPTTKFIFEDVDISKSHKFLLKEADTSTPGNFLYNEVDDLELRKVPFWEIHMVFDLISPWRWNASTSLSEQIALPRSISLCVVAELPKLPQERGSGYYPDGAQTCLAQLQGEFSAWWSRKPNWVRQHVVSYMSYVISPNKPNGMDWYFSTAQLTTDYPLPTVANAAVIAFGAVQSQSPDGSETITQWQGDFIGSGRSIEGY